jgi:tetratricopeptide (TPR) repeat protein
MSKEKSAIDQIDQIEVVKDVKDITHKVGGFYETNKKMINYIGTAIIVLVLGYIAYNYFVLKPNEEQASEELYKIEHYFAIDSLNVVLNGNAAKEVRSAVEVADEYGSTPSGQKAAYMAGMAYLKKGDFENAIEYLKKFDLNDLIVSSLAKGAIGDAYAELKQFDEAADYYVKAAERRKNNLTTPYFYKKAALVYEKLDNYDKAVKYYELIKKDYPEAPEAFEIDKYIFRANTKLGKTGDN